jgi:hypothetical protein
MKLAPHNDALVKRVSGGPMFVEVPWIPHASVQRSINSASSIGNRKSLLRSKEIRQSLQQKSELMGDDLMRTNSNDSD